MKAINYCLYTCSSLMLVAAIAGSIDYAKANKNGTLNKLYKEEKPIEYPVVDKEINYEDYSRGEINRAVEVEPAEKSKSVTNLPSTPKNKHQPTIATIEKKSEEPTTTKKISYKRFSRGPLRDDEADEPILIDTAATIDVPKD